MKLAISLVYFVVCRGLAAPAFRLFGRRPKGTAVVLYYHAVTPDVRSRFARQMDVLARLEAGSGGLDGNGQWRAEVLRGNV